MDIIISNTSVKPIYEQVYEQIASQILNGSIEPNFCLPSYRAVAVELGISVITIKKAWDLLLQEGLIYTRAGKGCFVLEHPKANLESKKTELAIERLKTNLPYYRGLGLTKVEMIDLIDKLY